MGAGQSADQQRSSELLAELSGTTTIPLDSPFWESLTAAFPEPLVSHDPNTVQERLQPFCEQLLVCNPISRNFQMLVLHTVGQLASQQQGTDALGLKAAANCTHLVTAVIKVAAETGNGSSLLQSLFEVTQTLPLPQAYLTASGDHVLLKLLVRRVLLTLLSVQPKGPGYLLSLELLQLLVILMSATQLGNTHVRGPPGSHPGVEALCSMTNIAPKVVVRLLTLYMSRPLPPEECMDLCQPRAATATTGGPQGSESSTLGSVASAASALFWLPATALGSVVGAVMGSSATRDSSQQGDGNTHTGSHTQGTGGAGWGLSAGYPLSPSPLADLSVFALLLLIHAPHLPNQYNPFVYALRGLHDSSQRLTTDSHVVVELQGADSGTLGSQRNSASSVHVDSAHSNPLHHTHTDTDTDISFTDLSEALSRALQAPAVLAPKPTTATTSSAAHAAQHMSAAQGTGTAGEAAGSGGGTGCVWPEAAWRLGAPLLSSGSEEALGLLYVLVTQNSAYQEHLLHHPDMPRLLLPLLRALYLCEPPQQPRLLFLCQTLLLVMSQAEEWARRVHRHTLTHAVTWCKESMSKATLGSLLLVVLIRTVSRCWSVNTDSALTSPANAMAALANLAPYVTHIHARAAQRLVALLTVLVKRYKRVGGQLGGPVPLSAALAGATQPATHSTVEANVVEDYLRLTLEILNSCVTGPSPQSEGAGHRSGPGSDSGTLDVTQHTLTGLSIHVPRTSQLATNVELVYVLLHQQETIASLRAHPRLGPLADNLYTVIEFFNRYLAQVQSGTSKASRSSSKGSEPLLPTHHVINSDSSGTLDTNVSSSSGAGSTEQYSTPDQVLAVLTHAVTHWRPETVKTFTQLRYAFKEEEEPENFFVSYTYQLVLQRVGSLPWDARALGVLSGTADDAVEIVYAEDDADV